MPPPLDYSTERPLSGRRWLLTMAVVTLLVGLVALGYDGVPRVIEGWTLLHRPVPRHHSVSLLPFAYFAAGVALVGAAILLIVAGGVTFRRPVAGVRLHLAYVGTMLPIAAVFACIYAGGMASDPEVPPPITLIVFVIVTLWFAAYPLAVAGVVYGKLRHLLPVEKDEPPLDPDPWGPHG